MQETIKTDVLVVGAGPTGLSLACQFVRHGVEFVVVEKNGGVTPYSKAIGVHARTLEIYEQMGLAREALEQGTVAGKVRLAAGATFSGTLNSKASSRPGRASRRESGRPGASRVPSRRNTSSAATARRVP